MHSVGDGLGGWFGHGLGSLYQQLSEYGLAEIALMSAMNPLQRCDVDLGHLHHRHDARSFVETVISATH